MLIFTAYQLIIPRLVHQVLKFNGTRVRNLHHLAEMVISCQDTYLRFDCEYNETVIVERAAAVAGTQHVLEAHSIPQALSPDLLGKLPQWPPANAQMADRSDEKVAEAVAIAA